MTPIGPASHATASYGFWGGLVVLTLGLALLHPYAFGAAWIVLLLLAVTQALRLRSAASMQARPQSAVLWLIVFGPLLIAYLVSAFVHGLAIGRIEALEPVLGGAILAAVLQQQQQLRMQWLITGAALGGLAAIGVVAIDMLLLKEPRAGMQHHPINFGIACGAALLILIQQFQHARQPILWGAAACAIGLIASGSRGPILACLLCILVIAVARGFGAWQLPGRRTTWLIAIALLLGAAIIVIGQRFMVDAQLGKTSSISIRWALIWVSLNQIVATPWVGIGADQAGSFFASLGPPVNSVSHAHVTLLNLGLELGILGALAWLWAFGGMFYLFWRADKFIPDNPIGATGMLLTAYFFVCSMMQDLMSHAFNRRFLSVVLVLLLVLLCRATKAKNQASVWGLHRVT